MAEVRKHGSGNGATFSDAVQRAMEEQFARGGSGAPPGPTTRAPGSTGSTQNMVTATSFLTADPFLPRTASASRGSADVPTGQDDGADT